MDLKAKSIWQRCCILPTPGYSQFCETDPFLNRFIFSTALSHGQERLTLRQTPCMTGYERTVYGFRHRTLHHTIRPNGGVGWR